MRVLIGCEYSQIVCKAFRTRGHEAYSCDLLPSEGGFPEWHYQKDVLEMARYAWDLAIFHPPCTYLTVAAEWAYKEKQTKKIKEGTLTGKERQKARDKASDFFLSLANMNHIPKIAIENPIGVMSSRYREPDQFIQPYEYGDDASKRTCLWLKNLPPLKPTKLVTPRLAKTKDGRGYTFRWANQTDNGQNREPPSEDRGKIRSLFYEGWAEAMAEQWGGV